MHFCGGCSAEAIHHSAREGARAALLSTVNAEQLFPKSFLLVL